jgi:pimeloyl-ACP methyl ester carboxylesterase
MQLAGFTVLLIDARNHGGSDADTFSSIPRFAEDLDATDELIAFLHSAFKDRENRT